MRRNERFLVRDAEDGDGGDEGGLWGGVFGEVARVDGEFGYHFDFVYIYRDVKKYKSDVKRYELSLKVVEIGVMVRNALAPHLHLKESTLALYVSVDGQKGKYTRRLKIIQ